MDLEMSVVLLFHYAHGLSPCIVPSADTSHGVGHIVGAPDLIEGRTSDTHDKGMSFMVIASERREAIPHNL
jgi:hypothetical protein